MPPSIAVVLNVTEASPALDHVLQSLRTQTLAQDAFETIAINNGAGEAIPTHASMRVLHQARAPASAAWNLATFATTAPIIVLAPLQQAFAPSALDALLKAHTQHGGAADIICATPSNGSALQTALATDPNPWRSPHTAISFKRTLLVNHGLFDPRFEEGWERAELIWRLRARRPRLIQAQETLLQWNAEPSFAEEGERHVRQGRCQARLAALHDADLVRRHAEIGAALALWKQSGASFDQTLQRAAATATPEAYRAALNLCRAKGVAAEIAGD